MYLRSKSPERRGEESDSASDATSDSDAGSGHEIYNKVDLMKSGHMKSGHMNESSMVNRVSTSEGPRPDRPDHLRGVRDRLNDREVSHRNVVDPRGHGGQGGQGEGRGSHGRYEREGRGSHRRSSSRDEQQHQNQDHVGLLRSGKGTVGGRRGYS